MFLSDSCTMNAMTGSDWKRVGDLVIQRRTELGMRTAKALADAMGLTPRLVGDIENGRRTNYGAGTVASIELALQWKPGSIASILDGGDPTPIDQPAPAPVEPEDDEPLVVIEARALWDRVTTLADSPDGDPARESKARRAVLATGDVLTDFLLALNAGPPAKPLIQEMLQRALHILENPLQKEESNDLEVAPQPSASPEAVEDQEVKSGGEVKTPFWFPSRKDGKLEREKGEHPHP